MKIYRVIASTPTRTTFALTTSPDEKLAFSSDRTTVQRNGVSAPIVRSSLVLTKPISLMTLGCDDQCGPRGLFTESIRLEISSPSIKKADVLADLAMIVKILNENDSILDGFIPPSSVDITYEEV